MKLSSKDLLELIREAAEEKKAYDIKAIDVSSVTVITDYFLICTSDSNVQSRAIADAIEDKLEENGFRVNSREGYRNGEWVVMDTRKVIIHIFTPEVREYYNLERFWEEEIGLIQKGSSDNLSSMIKARKKAPVKKPGKAAAAKKDARKAAAAKTAKKPVVVEKKKPLTKKEEIEREIMKKAGPAKKTILAKEKPAEKSRKQQIEEEIIRQKQKKEANRARQKAEISKKKAAEAVKTFGKNDAKKMREKASFASKAKAAAGTMSALKIKKGGKK